jgi:hypothetical protein
MIQTRPAIASLAIHLSAVFLLLALLTTRVSVLPEARR